MPSVTGKVEGKRMKKILIAVVPFMLAGCSYYNQFVERMQTDTLESTSSGRRAIPLPSINAIASSSITVSCRRPNVEISVGGAHNNATL